MPDPEPRRGGGGVASPERVKRAEGTCDRFLPAVAPLSVIVRIVYLTTHLSVYYPQGMDYLTTTELRTKSAKLIDFLKRDIDVTLIYRSKIIGRILPQIEEIGLKDLKGFKSFLEGLRPSKLISQRKRNETYRRQLVKKYG